MPTIRISRLALHMKGVDIATAREAARALPQALARQARAPQAPAPAGPVRFDAPPSTEALTQRVAQHVAASVRAHIPRTRGGR